MKQLITIIIFFTILIPNKKTYADNIKKNNFGFYSVSSVFYSNTNDQLDFINKYESVTNPKGSVRSLSFGFYEDKGDYRISVQTSRFLNSDVSSRVIDKKTNKQYLYKYKILSDTLLIGKKFSQRTVASFLISNSKIESKLIDDEKGVIKEGSNSSVLFGANLNYYINKDFGFSFTYIAPNEDMNIDSAFGVGMIFAF